MTVGFEPRPGDRWTVGGDQPRPLPAGRRSGADLRAAAEPAPTPVDSPVLEPGTTIVAEPAAARAPADEPTTTYEPAAPVTA